MKREIFSKFTELSADLLEPALDAIVDNEILRDIPVLGSAVKIASLGQTISDRIFLAKIQRFLAALESVSSPEAQLFAEELSSGNVDASRTAETLLLAIDIADDLGKTSIIAAVFQAFLQGHISKSEFRRIIAAINAAVLDDLLAVAAFGAEPSGSGKEHSDLINALRHTGLTGEAKAVYVRPESPDLAEAITPLGKAFARAVSSSGDRTKDTSTNSSRNSGGT
jgi:hypothetical protein